MKSKLNKKIEVLTSSKHGKGLFANQKIKKNELLGKMEGVETNVDGIHVLWITKDSGIIVDNDLKYSNHNWENPNAELVNLKLYSNKDIEEGEEILWDYSCGYKFEQTFDLAKPLFDNMGLSVIHHSILNNDVELFKKSLDIIVSKDIDVSTFVDDESTMIGEIIHWIGASGTPEMLVYYLSKNSDFFRKNVDGLNVYNFAKIFENKSIINYLKTFLTEQDFKKLKK